MTSLVVIISSFSSFNSINVAICPALSAGTEGLSYFIYYHSNSLPMSKEYRSLKDFLAKFIPPWPPNTKTWFFSVQKVKEWQYLGSGAPIFDS